LKLWTLKKKNLILEFLKKIENFEILWNLMNWTFLNHEKTGEIA
jgi:hypothetical protein